jgi:thiamine-phosphate pyrophosphorylase
LRLRVFALSMLFELPASPFLYPILDATFSTNLFVDAQAVIRAGAKILQIRAKNVTKRKICEIVTKIALLCEESDVCCLINDCVDIALVTRVSGVHLGQLDFPVPEARALLHGKIIGYSTHNAEQFAAAKNQPVDYIAIGPVFATTTKAYPDPVLGLPEVRAIVKQKTKPVVAIGGIDHDQIPQLIDSGIDGIAVISALYRDGGVYENASKIMERVLAKI